MSNERLNGSVERLAQALSEVFTEAIEPVREDIKAQSVRIDTISENIQSQLAQHRKDVSDQFAQHREDVNGILDKRLPR